MPPSSCDFYCNLYEVCAYLDSFPSPSFVFQYHVSVVDSFDRKRRILFTWPSVIVENGGVLGSLWHVQVCSRVLDWIAKERGSFVEQLRKVFGEWQV